MTKLLSLLSFLSLSSCVNVICGDGDITNIGLLDGGFSFSHPDGGSDAGERVRVAGYFTHSIGAGYPGAVRPPDVATSITGFGEVDSAVPGSRSSACAARYADAGAMTDVVWLCGIVDMLIYGMDEPQAVASAQATLGGALDAGQNVVVVSELPCAYNTCLANTFDGGDLNVDIRTYNVDMKSWALARSAHARFVDVYPLFLHADGGFNSSLFVDLLHPTEPGALMIGQGMGAALLDLP